MPQQRPSPDEYAPLLNDNMNRSDDEVGHVDASELAREGTPLPKLQLAIVYYLQLSEPMTSMVIIPFINEVRFCAIPYIFCP